MIKNINKGFLFVLLPLLIITCKNINKEADIYGQWKSSNNNDEFSIIFNADRTCNLNYFDKQSNKFEKITGIYELDFSKTPIPLSIRKITQLNHPLFTIIKFTNDDSIIMAEFSTKSRLRPITFAIKKNIILNRITELN